MATARGNSSTAKAARAHAQPRYATSGRFAARRAVAPPRPAAATRTVLADPARIAATAKGAPAPAPKGIPAPAPKAGK